MRQNNTESNAQTSQIILTEHIQNFARAIAKLNIQFGIPFPEFVEIYKVQLLKELKRQNPNQNIRELAYKSGINRRGLNDVINEPVNEIIKTKELDVLEELTAYFETNDTDRIPLKNHISSFKSIVDKMYKGQESYLIIANELVNKGCIKIENNEVIYLSKHLTYSADPNKFLMLAAREVNSLLTCIIDNYKFNNKGTNKVQRALWSDQIPEEGFVDVKEEIEDAVKIFRQTIDKILVKKEMEMCLPNGQKHPSGSFERIGLGIYHIGPES